MKKVHLSREQRYTISAMHKQGCTQKMIADAIGKDKSVICRELKRNPIIKAGIGLNMPKRWQHCEKNA